MARATVDRRGNHHDPRNGRFTTHKGWQESEVSRTRRGGIVHRARGTAMVEKIKATARQLMDMEDRRGPRLRWGEKGTAGWWYIPRGGAVYWVKREAKPTWIRNYYYIPSSWAPVTPPRESWPAWNSYHGIAGKTKLSTVIPDDVWKAAQGTAVYKRQGEDRSARNEEMNTRRTRGNLGEESRKTRGLKTVKVTRKPRKTTRRKAS